MWTAILSFILQRMLFLALHLESSSFPRPLSAAEEQECFVLLRQGTPEQARQARDRLIQHNLRLVSHIAKKYYAGSGQEPDDLISIGTIGLIKGVDSFDPQRCKRFSTYAARCVENEILMQFRLQRKYQKEISLEEPMDGTDPEQGLTYADVVGDPVQLQLAAEETEEMVRVRNLVERQLTGRDRQIILLRYGFVGQRPMTQQQVADLLGISRSYVSRLETRTLQTLRVHLIRD